MHYSTVTTKGQATIPAAIREKMSISIGDKLEFIDCGDYIAILPINKDLASLKGILPKPDQALSLEEIAAVIKDSYDRY